MYSTLYFLQNIMSSISIFFKFFFNFFVLQSLSQCLTLCNPMDCTLQATLFFTISWSLPKYMSTESMMLSNHPIFCFPLLFLPSIIPRIRVFSNELAVTSCGQSIGTSASASVFPMNTQSCFPLKLTGLIFLESKGLSRVFSGTTV